MIIKPMVRNNICMNAHPTGCAVQVQRQVDYVKSKGLIEGTKNALIIGASTGYGLASRIMAAFGCGAKTIGVFFEKPGSERRAGTSGWYNNIAFESIAAQEGLFAKSVNGDAFSDETKQQTIGLIEGKIDLVIYSLASPVRTDPETGVTYRSAIKPLNKPYTVDSLDPLSGEKYEVVIDPASEDEIASTIKVMGGEDWLRWMKALRDADVLAPSATTVAYSYIGPTMTYPIYREGTIGKAKQHLESTVPEINRLLEPINGAAFVSVNKALVTRASAVIPVVPLYISLLYKVMKEKDLHERCVEQIQRLFAQRLYTGNPIPVDDQNRVRIDDWELRSDVQEEVHRRWEIINPDNYRELADVEGFETDFMEFHGFGIETVDYGAEVTP